MLIIPETVHDFTDYEIFPFAICNQQSNLDRDLETTCVEWIIGYIFIGLIIGLQSVLAEKDTMT